MGTKQSFIVIIPARLQSTRFPNKVLADLHGKPLLQHVYERARDSGAKRVIIATCDDLIAEHGRTWGAEVCMTDSDCTSGSDRILQAAQHLKLPSDQIIVNVQGDEPRIPSAVIKQVADMLLGDVNMQVATLSEPIVNYSDFVDPNITKLVCDDSGKTLYFSRAPIPYPRDELPGKTLPHQSPVYRHIGLYGYRYAALKFFAQCPPHPLELTEKLEQLRFLANGVNIHVTTACENVPSGIDTPEQLAEAQALPP